MASLSVKGGNVQERREEDANLKLEDLGLACPLESETQVPGWVQTLGKYLSVVGSLHDLLIQSFQRINEGNNLSEFYLFKPSRQVI